MRPGWYNLIRGFRRAYKLRALNPRGPISWIKKVLWNELQQCWSWYIYCFFKLWFKMSLYAPIDWVGGPDKKIFCSRSWQMDFTVLGLCFITKILIFSCLTQPNWVNKHFFIWPLDVENFRYMQQQNPPKILQLKLFFLEVRTRNSLFFETCSFFLISVFHQVFATK